MPLDFPSLSGKKYTVGLTREFSATDTGFSATSVKAAATVAGNTLDLRGFRWILVSIAIDNTGGGSTGLAKLVVDVYDNDGNSLLGSFDLSTDINLKADNTYVVSFGGDQAAKQVYTSGTVTLATNADVLRVGARMKFSITTTEVSDSTTVTATMRVNAGA